MTFHRTVCFALMLMWPVAAVAESWLTLEPADYPQEVRMILDQVRSECKAEGHETVDAPGIGVTIVDLNRDGSKDIILEAWRVCSVEIKNFGACNTGGCDLKIFKQVGPHRWKPILDETIDPIWFLSASSEGYFRLMALSVSRKIADRCPDPDGLSCDFIVRWKKGRWAWDRIR